VWHFVNLLDPGLLQCGKIQTDEKGVERTYSKTCRFATAVHCHHHFVNISHPNWQQNSHSTYCSLLTVFAISQTVTELFDRTPAQRCLSFIALFFAAVRRFSDGCHRDATDPVQGFSVANPGFVVRRRHGISRTVAQHCHSHRGVRIVHSDPHQFQAPQTKSVSESQRT